MKSLLMVVMILFSIHSQAQVNFEELKAPKNEIPVDTMVYTRSGKSIGSFPEPQAITMNSIGVLRYEEVFMYGVEFNSFYSANENRMTDVQLLVGYRHIWNKKFLPYANLGFGYANFRNESNASLPNGDGIAITTDVGVDVYKVWKIKNSFGVRNTWGTFSSKEMPSTSFTDIYWMVGFVF